MEPKEIGRRNPEAKIQKRLISFLHFRGWIVKPTHGGMLQAGFPDLWASHARYGYRWIEVKLPQMQGSRWTEAQKEWFPKLSAHGTRIWILTDASESEYKKLFKEPNWDVYFYLYK